MEIKILDGEVWYATVCNYSDDMPYDSNTDKVVSLKDNPTNNQMNPFLISNKGRAVFKNDGYKAVFNKGVIIVDEEADFYDGGKNLKDSFNYINDKYFSKDIISISEDLLEKPLYNTWMHAPYDVNSDKVIDYAKKIIEEGLPVGTLIIDDMWSKEYGTWEFDEKKFPDPEKTIEYIHKTGFNLMLWICPYISFNTDRYYDCLEKGLLLMDGDKAYELEWWNGKSAVYDFRKEEAVEYFREQLKKLTDMGIDGFKFDGGDSMYYKKEHQGDLQSHLWGELSKEYKFNELRAEYYNAGASIYERLSDKRHSWDDEGINLILPASLNLGLAGHPFFSADMIGGGQVDDIRNGNKLDKEIFIAHCQLAMFLPSVQFSILPSKVLGDDMYILHNLLKQREKFMPYIKELITDSRVGKKPVARLMEYEFPGEGFEYVSDQFMLGDKYIVMPVTKQGQKVLSIKLPKGEWKIRGEIYKGGRSLSFDTIYDEVLIAEKITQNL